MNNIKKDTVLVVLQDVPGIFLLGEIFIVERVEHTYFGINYIVSCYDMNNDLFIMPLHTGPIVDCFDVLGQL